MAFKKGDPKPEGSGRKKGTPHKKSTLVKAILDNHGIDLVEQIIVRLPKLTTEEQVKALIQMLPYAYPKLTAVEHSGTVANPYLENTLEELEDLVKQEIKKK